MKRIICLLVILCMMVSGSCALAEISMTVQGTTDEDVLFQVACCNPWSRATMTASSPWAS